MITDIMNIINAEKELEESQKKLSEVSDEKDRADLVVDTAISIKESKRAELENKLKNYFTNLKKQTNNKINKLSEQNKLTEKGIELLETDSKEAYKLFLELTEQDKFYLLNNPSVKIREITRESYKNLKIQKDLLSDAEKKPFELTLDELKQKAKQKNFLIPSGPLYTEIFYRALYSNNNSAQELLDKVREREDTNIILNTTLTWKKYVAEIIHNHPGNKNILQHGLFNDGIPIHQYISEITKQMKTNSLSHVNNNFEFRNFLTMSFGEHFYIWNKISQKLYEKPAKVYVPDKITKNRGTGALVISFDNSLGIGLDFNYNLESKHYAQPIKLD